MAMQRAKVNERTVCVCCGGIGHGSTVDGVDCLTTQLGTKVSKDTLRKIKYPDGIAFPSFNRRQPSGQGIFS